MYSLTKKEEHDQIRELIEEEEEYIYIVDLENKNAQVRISNFGLDNSSNFLSVFIRILVKYLSYSNSLLFAASSEEISIIQVD